MLSLMRIGPVAPLLVALLPVIARSLVEILRYVKGTVTLGMTLTAPTTMDLYAFSDADWAGCPATRRSTTGYCTFLGGNLISWCVKKQQTDSRSNTEAEYRAMAHTVTELTWLTFVLNDLNCFLAATPILYCDNLSALHMTINPVFHARSKLIELDFHFVRERVALELLATRHISAAHQVADIFTKPMTKASLNLFRTKLCLQPRHSLREHINNTCEAWSYKEIGAIRSNAHMHEDTHEESSRVTLVTLEPLE
ncbi:hypothetical protein Dimus_038742 [Dionaea muscipula]